MFTLIRKRSPFFLYNDAMEKHSKHYYDTQRNKPYDYKGLDNYLDKVQETEAINVKQSTKSNETYDKVITLKVSNETYEAWELLQENWGDVIGYDNKSKIFEFAIIEALNIPIASLGGFKF